MGFTHYRTCICDFDLVVTPLVPLLPETLEGAECSNKSTCEQKCGDFLKPSAAIFDCTRQGMVLYEVRETEQWLKKHHAFLLKNECILRRVGGGVGVGG